MSQEQDALLYQPSRATVIYDTPSELESVDLPELPSTEDTDLELDEAPSNEVTNEDADLDAILSEMDTEGEQPTEDDDTGYTKYRERLEQDLGMPLAEAKALIEELVAERQQRTVREMHSELASHWGVGTKDVEQRLVEVKKLWDKLPADKQAQYDNVQGAIAIWARLEASGKVKSTPRLDKNSTGSTVAQTKYWYTQAQISELMKNPNEYAKHADRITIAYQQGRVKR